MTKRSVVVFAVVAIGLIVFGIVMLIGIRVDPAHYGEAPMAEYYLGMACRCPWPITGVPWSIHTVPPPYRYRVLVPWLAGLLPLEASTALSLVTYVSLGVSYFVVLVACRRLGLGIGASLCGLALAYVFEPNLYNFYHPFLVDGFSLMIVVLMLYAYLIDAFWPFALLGLAGLFAREVVWFALPLWCARNLKRGVVLTTVAVIALVVERSLIYGPPYTAPYTADPITIALFHWHAPLNFARDMFGTWSWAFGAAAIGIALLPADVFRTVGPVALVLSGAAVASSVLATDVIRLFGVLVPIVAIAGARLAAVLAERRQRVLLVSLCALIALQFCVSGGTRLSPAPAALAATVRPIRLGMLWVIAAACVLRGDLARCLREKKVHGSPFVLSSLAR